MSAVITAGFVDDGEPKTSLHGVVPISDFGILFSALGISNERWANWHERYGYDSAGVGSDGERLLPGYPFIGKLMDALIDPIFLGPDESSKLAAECARVLGVCRR